MKIYDTMRAKAALAAVAAQEGISLAEVERSIQEAIDAAWEAPTATQEQLRLFPAGKPTPIQFIATIRREVKSRGGSGTAGPEGRG